MNNSKIKKHFSLFMVQKSIKKKTNDSNIKQLFQEEIQNPSQSIPKFIDPITCYRLSGNINFIDKLYEQDVGLISMHNRFKSITMVEYDNKHECWLANLLDLNYPLDSWSLIYDRLMSLGDVHAYSLAQTIDEVIISKQNLSLCEEKKPPKQNQQENNYFEEVEKLFQMKKNSVFFFCIYHMSTPEKGLEVNRIGFSKQLVQLVFESEYNFIDHLIRFGFFDFLTVEKERYFDSINNNIRCLNSEDKFSSQKKLQTLDGQWCTVIPNVTTKIQVNEKGETVELFIALELKPNEEFSSLVKNNREEKTKFRNRKSKREMDLENLLKFYYNDEESNKKNPNIIIENLEAIEDASLNKRCGYRIINK